jgi:hypothetical protein
MNECDEELMRRGVAAFYGRIGLTDVHHILCHKPQHTHTHTYTTRERPMAAAKHGHVAALWAANRLPRLGLGAFATQRNRAQLTTGSSARPHSTPAQPTSLSRKKSKGLTDANGRLVLLGAAAAACQVS